MSTRGLLTFAGVTVLTGVIAMSGCSDANEPGDVAPDAAAGDVTPSRPAADAEIVDEGDPCRQPFGAQEIEQELGSPYKGPNGIATRDCTDVELTQLAANFEDHSLRTYEDLGKGLAASCVGCVFSKTTDANWGPIVLLASDTTKGFGNFGACHAALNGVACGRAFQYDRFCADAACSECSDSQTDRCMVDVRGPGGACKDLHDAIATSCPDLAASTEACGDTLLQHVAVLCGSGVALDAGADG